MIEPDLRTLERRAYGRDSSPEERAAAEAELARIRAEQADAAAATSTTDTPAGSGEAPAPPEPEATLPTVDIPHFAVATGMVLATLGVAAVVAATGAAYAVDAARSSLDVFDRPQDERDLGAPDWIGSAPPDALYQPLPETVRWLASYDDITLYGNVVTEGMVCLALVEGSLGGSSACTPIAAFRQDGISLVGIGPYSVHWGPKGDPQFTDATNRQPGS